MVKTFSKEEGQKSGIYIITNLINNKFYIGSTINFNKRFNQHFSNFKINKNNSPYLKNAVNKYGIQNFSFEILDYVEDKKDLLLIEHMYIVLLECTNKKVGYNRLKFCDNLLGFKHSKDSKEKMSKSHIGIQSGEKNPMFNIVGEANPRSVLNNEIVIKIKKLFIENILTNREISKIFDVGITTIIRIKSGKSWSHIKLFENENFSEFKPLNVLKNISKIGEENASAKLNEKNIIEILNLLKEKKLKQKEIAEIYGVSAITISNINTRKTWKHLII